MKTTMKIALACFIGAVMGTLISLEMNKMLWWVGAIAGGVIGYFIYDIEQVIKAIPKTWEYAKENKNKFSCTLVKIIKNIIIAIFCVTAVLIVPFIWLGYIDNYFWNIFHMPKISLIHDDIFVLLPILFIYYAMALINFLILIYSAKDILVENDKCLKKMKLLGIINKAKNSNIFKIFALLSSQLIAFGWIIFWLYKGFTAVPEATKEAFNVSTEFLGKFIKKLFLLIHSQARLICGVDSLFGTVIGYFFFHDPIMGGIAGAILGVFNYWIVSIKILKLEPKL